MQDDMPMLSYTLSANQFEMHGYHNNISSHLLLITFLSVQVPSQVRKWPNKYAFSTTSWKKPV